VRIDLYPDENSAEAIAALVNPYTCVSTVINRLIAEAASS